MYINWWFWESCSWNAWLTIHQYWMLIFSNNCDYPIWKNTNVILEFRFKIGKNQWSSFHCTAYHWFQFNLSCDSVEANKLNEKNWKCIYLKKNPTRQSPIEQERLIKWFDYDNSLSCESKIRKEQTKNMIEFVWIALSYQVLMKCVKVNRIESEVYYLLIYWRARFTQRTLCSMFYLQKISIFFQ